MNEIKHSFRPGDLQDEALEIRKAVTLVRSGAVDSYSYDSSKQTVVATLVEMNCRRSGPYHSTG